MNWENVSDGGWPQYELRVGPYIFTVTDYKHYHPSKLHISLIVGHGDNGAAYLVDTREYANSDKAKKVAERYILLMIGSMKNRVE